MSFEINKTYSFSTLAPTILGGLHSALKVVAILSADEAAMDGFDIYTRHATLRSIITDLTITPKDLTFVKFETTLQNETVVSVLAIEYIDTPSIELVATLNARINVFGTTSDSISVMRIALKEVGITNFNIEIF